MKRLSTKSILLLRKQWSKDDEYGYHHLSDMSGGLDSRMNYWVAKSMNKGKAMLMTYCKSGYLDEQIAMQVAEYWHEELLFKPLDDASFMFDIDENTAMLGGLSFYSGITGGKRMLESLDLASYGIEHTGMIGDVALGSFFNSSDELRKNSYTPLYSNKLTNRLGDNIFKLYENYPSIETYLMYVRGFHGACNTHLIRENYIEVWSPFLDIDFLQLCFDLPPEKKVGHYIYKKWMIAKYPEAANIRWEKTNGLINEGYLITTLKQLGRRLSRKVKKMIGLNSQKKWGMNPLDYWLETNTELSIYMDEYMEDAVQRVEEKCSKQLIVDLHMMYTEGNAIEKSMVLTVLSTIKQFVC